MKAPTNSKPISVPRVATHMRRGLATGWLIIWSPIFLAMVLLAIEVGNVMLAKVQLENALEAGALAGVKQWKQTGDTYIARVAAQQYAAANHVSTVPVLLNLNTNNNGPGQDPDPPPNGNILRDGEIVLGAVSIPDTVDDCTEYIFDPGTSPTSVAGDLCVSLCVRVFTTTDTKGDVQAGEYPFSIFDYSAQDCDTEESVDDLEIASVVLNVSTVPVVGELSEAFFDLRPQNPKNLDAVGPDRKTGVKPIFFSNNVVGFTASPAFTDDVTSQTYAIGFPAGSPNPFLPGDDFSFGVDTDGVGPDTGPQGIDKPYADLGGDFVGTTVTVTFRLANGDIAGFVTGTMELCSDGDPNDGKDHCAQICFMDQELQSGGLFGVRTSKTMEVMPICKELFGFPVGPFEVCGVAAAVCAPNETPRLIRIRQFISEPSEP